MSPKRERMLFCVFISFLLSEAAEINDNLASRYSSSLKSNGSYNPQFYITAIVWLNVAAAK